MNLRHLMKFLSTGEVVDRLANTPLIRKLAQMTHFSYMKASQAGQKSIDNMAAKQQQKNQLSNDSFMMSRFFQRFVQNLRNEIEKQNNSKFK